MTLPNYPGVHYDPSASKRAREAKERAEADQKAAMAKMVEEQSSLHFSARALAPTLPVVAAASADGDQAPSQSSTSNRP